MSGQDHRGALPRFLAVGLSAVAIDAVVYALVAPGLGPDLGKAVGYVAGAAFGYVANWKFTFGARRGRWSEVAFVGVYATSLGLNVLVNAVVLALLAGAPLSGALAFLCATGASTVWNYVGMSSLVFVRRRPEPAE